MTEIFYSNRNDAVRKEKQMMPERLEQGPDWTREDIPQGSQGGGAQATNQGTVKCMELRGQGQRHKEKGFSFDPVLSGKSEERSWALS